MSIDQRKKQRERLPLISMAIILAGLILLFSVTFLTWWSFMPTSDQDYPKPELTAEQKTITIQLEEDVRYLADEIGERNMHRPGTMDSTAAWIERRFLEMEFSPVRHTYQLQRGVYSGRSADNIIVEIEGTEKPNSIVIVGAHYDTVPHSPGANDNGSAVAALLSLAECFRDNPTEKTLRFVVFANEEPPFFKTEDMGSYAYARELQSRGENVTAMFSMDGLGSFSDEPGSQRYPLPGIGFIYPDKANFIGFVTRFSDMGLMKRSLKAFRKNAEISAEGVAMPGIVPGVDWSDHWSFWQHDFPAFLVTDTLPFRDRYYHSPMDTPDKIDFERMTLVVEGLRYVIIELGSNR
ncbi:MAG: M20/M25/M40 family metallo-hydrolase [Balneolaceae bacterium]|nr:MAG: M20/M25/M40 family metallo-hydrolase [Balneolaceae bacterium]